MPGEADEALIDKAFFVWSRPGDGAVKVFRQLAGNIYREFWAGKDVSG
jgi:hypothetical protein